MSRRVARLFWSDSEPVELQSGAFIALVGVWLLLPQWQTFTGPSFGPFLRYSSESVVGLVMLAHGATVMALAALPAVPRTRATAALVTVAIHAFWAVLLWQGNQAGTGWISWFVLAWGPVWVAVRLGLERRAHGR